MTFWLVAAAIGGEGAADMTEAENVTLLLGVSGIGPLDGRFKIERTEHEVCSDEYMSGCRSCDEVGSVMGSAPLTLEVNAAKGTTDAREAVLELSFTRMLVEESSSENELVRSLADEEGTNVLSRLSARAGGGDAARAAREGADALFRNTEKLRCLCNHISLRLRGSPWGRQAHLF